MDRIFLKIGNSVVCLYFGGVKLIKTLRELPKAQKFLFRITYPVLIYSALHFTAKALGSTDLLTVRLIFFGIWSLIEYFVYFNAKSNKE